MKKSQKLIILSFILILLSCTYSNFLLSSIKNSYKVSWDNKYYTVLTIVSIERIFRLAIKLPKIPDGGILIIIYLNVCVYHYGMESNKLSKVGEI